MKPHWFRVARRRRFHAERADWVQSGRAVCGALIRSPSWVKFGNDIQLSDRDLCRNCVRALEARAS